MNSQKASHAVSFPWVWYCETPQESDTLVTYIFDSIFTVNSFRSIHKQDHNINYLEKKISTLNNIHLIKSITINAEQDWRI